MNEHHETNESRCSITLRFISCNNAFMHHISSPVLMCLDSTVGADFRGPEFQAVLENTAIYSSWRPDSQAILG